jgi:hypothetical protein
VTYWPCISPPNSVVNASNNQHKVVTPSFLREKNLVQWEKFLRTGLQIFCLKLVSVLSDDVAHHGKKIGKNSKKKDHSRLFGFLPIRTVPTCLQSTYMDHCLGNTQRFMSAKQSQPTLKERMLKVKLKWVISLTWLRVIKTLCLSPLSKRVQNGEVEGVNQESPMEVWGHNCVGEYVGGEWQIGIQRMWADVSCGCSWSDSGWRPHAARECKTKLFTVKALNSPN